ncbi:MAG: PQQ-binding-like beta-propeller repeat protein [Candidatus Brocadiaceae bacterium]|nr:PQQ-binding-like beta-propeller repeat protein [Candidatus Brocadiaceae bacterium]
MVLTGAMGLDGLLPLGVVPVLVGPLQALMAILPGILVALGTTLLALLRPSAIKRFLQLLWAQKFACLGIGLGIWGLVYFWGDVFPGAAADVGAAVSGADWPMWRGGAQRRGAVLGEAEDPAHGNVVWRFFRGDVKSYYSSPTVVGNRVYATSARPGVFATEGAINCLDAETGELAWEFTAEGYRATFSSPAVLGRYLVVGEGLHLTSDARVFCLDLDQSNARGRAVKLWSYRTASHVESSPCIADGKVFIGAGDDGLYCFDLEGDGSGEGVVLWHLKGEDYPDCETSPVYEDGRVYFGLGIGGQAVVCVDADTGRELWRVETPCPVFSSPTVAGGKLFVGMGHGDFINTAEAVREIRRAALIRQGASPEEADAAVAHIRKGGQVWCIDLATQEVEWPFDTERTVLGTIAEADGRLYFGSRDGHAYCVDAATGGAVGRPFDAHSPITGSVAVGRKLLYAVTEAGVLYGLDRERMTSVWKVSLGSPSSSSPVLARGHVYVGTTNNGLMCVGRPGAEVKPPIWAGELGGPGRSGWTDDSVITAAGAFAWTGYVGEDGEVARSLESRTPVAGLPGACYVGLTDGGQHGLARFDYGEDPGGRPTRAWFAPAANAVVVSAAATADRVFFVDGEPGDQGRALHCLNAETGTELWARPVSGDASGRFFITPDRLFIADVAEGLSCLSISSDGTPPGLWSVRAGPVVGLPFLLDDLLFVAASAPGSVLALDALSGERLWTQSLETPPRTGPVFAAGRVWVGLEDGLAGLDPTGDSQALRVPCGAVSARLAFNDVRLACVTDDGRIHLVDPYQGEVLAGVEGALAGLPPVLTHDELLYFTADDLRRWNLNAPQAGSERWSLTRWMGDVLAPAVVIESHVLFPTLRRGLVCLKPEAQE